MPNLFWGDGCLERQYIQSIPLGVSSTFRGGAVGGDRGHFNPSLWDQRQNNPVNQGPKDLGAHGHFFFFFASQHASPDPSSDNLISSIFTSASFQGGKNTPVRAKFPLLTQRQTKCLMFSEPPLLPSDHHTIPQFWPPPHLPSSCSQHETSQPHPNPLPFLLLTQDFPAAITFFLPSIILFTVV